MSYERAIEILGLATPKSLERNAELARSIQSHLTLTAPLRYSVACQVVIDAASY